MPPFTFEHWAANGRAKMASQIFMRREGWLRWIGKTIFFPQHPEAAGGGGGGGGGGSRAGEGDQHIQVLPLQI